MDVGVGSLDRGNQAPEQPLRTSARRASIRGTEVSAAPLSPPPVDASPLEYDDEKPVGKRKGKGKDREPNADEEERATKKLRTSNRTKAPATTQRVKLRIADTPTEEVTLQQSDEPGGDAATVDPASHINDDADPTPAAVISFSKAKPKKRIPDMGDHPAPAPLPAPEEYHVESSNDAVSPASSSADSGATATPVPRAQVGPSETFKSVPVMKGKKQKRASPDYSSSDESKKEQSFEPVPSEEDETAFAAVLKSAGRGGKRGKKVITSPEPETSMSKAPLPKADEQDLQEAVREGTKEPGDESRVAKTKHLDKPSPTAQASKSASPGVPDDQLSPVVPSPARAELNRKSPPGSSRPLPKVGKKSMPNIAAPPSRPASTDGEKRIASGRRPVKKPPGTVHKPPAPATAVPSLLQGTLAALQGGKTASNPKADAGTKVSTSLSRNSFLKGRRTQEKKETPKSVRTTGWTDEWIMT